MIIASGFGEQGLLNVVDVAVRVVEAAGAVVIFAGAVIAFGRFFLVSLRREGMDPFAPVRLDLGRFLALGLEFQLAADILRTAVHLVSPSWRSWRRLRPSGRRSTSSSAGRSRRKAELVRADQAAAATTRGRSPGSGDDRQRSLSQP